MCLLVTLVLLVAVTVDGASGNSFVTSSPNSASTIESTVQVNESFTDSDVGEQFHDEIQSKTQEMNISIDLENSTYHRDIHSQGNNENKNVINYKVHDGEQIVNTNESKMNIRQSKRSRRRQIRKLRQYISTVPYILKRINSSDTADNSNRTTSKRILMIPKKVMRNLLSKYQKMVSQVDETKNETLETETVNENSTNQNENKNSSNLFVNFVRLFESDNPISRKRIHDIDDHNDDDDYDEEEEENIKNTGQDKDKEDKDDIEEIMENIKNGGRNKDEEGYYDISDFIIDMLGGAAGPENNEWEFHPQNDLESRTEFPYEGITNFHDAKHALATDVVQSHMNSPTFDAKNEKNDHVDLTENLENGKMENLLWKDFFSFEIPDKVTKKPSFVPSIVNNNVKPHEDVVKGTHGVDGAYDYEDSESWESGEDDMYDYPDEAYTDYVDEYEGKSPKYGKVKSNVIPTVKAKTHQTYGAPVLGKLINHNAKNRNIENKRYIDYVDESNEAPELNIWNNKHTIKAGGKPFKSIIKEAFQRNDHINDGDYSEEYEAYSKESALLPHPQALRAQRLEQKSTSKKQGHGLFTKDQFHASSSEIEGDDDSISNDIDREETETDKIHFPFRNFHQSKKPKGSSESSSDEKSSHSSEIFGSSSEGSSSSSEEGGKRRLAFRHFAQSKSSSQSSGSYSNERASHSSQDLGSSSEQSFSSSDEDSSSDSSDESVHSTNQKRMQLNGSSDSDSNESSYSSEKSLSFSDENYSPEVYSIESGEKRSSENIHRHNWIHPRKSSDSSQSLSDYYSLESVSNEIFSSSDEDYVSSSEEHIPVVKENPRFVHIHQPKNNPQPVNHYYTFFKTQDWKRLDENRYEEESRRYHREHYEDDIVHETTTPSPPVTQHIPEIPPQPETPPKPFVLLERTAIVRTTMPPPPTPFFPIQTTTVVPPPTNPPPPAPPAYQIFRHFIPRTPPPQTQTPPPPAPPVVQRINILRTYITTPPPPPEPPVITTPPPPPPVRTNPPPPPVITTPPPPPPPAPPVVQRINIMRTHIPTPPPPPPPRPQPTPKVHIFRTKYIPFMPKPTPPPPPPPRPQPTPLLQVFRPPPKPQPQVPKPTPRPNLMQWYIPILYNTLRKFGKSQKPPPKPVKVKKQSPYDALQNEIMKIDLQQAWTNSYQKNLKKKNYYGKNSYDKPTTYGGNGGYGRTYSGNENLSYGKYGNNHQSKASYGSRDLFNPYHRKISSRYSNGYGRRGGYGYSQNVYPKPYTLHAPNFNTQFHAPYATYNTYGRHLHNSNPANEDCDKNGVSGNKLSFPSYNRLNSQTGYGLGFNGLFPSTKSLRY